MTHVQDPWTGVSGGTEQGRRHFSTQEEYMSATKVEKRLEYIEV